MKKLKQLKNKIELDIANNIIKTIKQKTGLSVYRVDDAIPQQILKILTNNDGLRKYLSSFSDDELYREISDFWVRCLMFQKPEEKNKKILLEKLSLFIDDLGKNKNYESYLFIPGIYEFPKGKLGPNFDVIPYGSIKKVKSMEVHVKKIIKRIKDISEKDISDGLWINYKFESPHSVEIIKYLKEELWPYLGIISLLCLGFSINQDLIFGLVENEKKCIFLEPKYTILDGRIRNGWVRFPCDIKEFRQRLNLARNIFKKDGKHRSQIEKKLLLFAKLFLFYNQSGMLEIKLLVLISALETLLLAGQDRDYIGEKTAEKTALLLGKDFNSRIEIYKFIKSQYAARSEFVHSGTSSIKAQSVRLLEGYCQEIFYKMLNYSKKYADISGEDGLDTVFYQIKFK